MILQGWLAFSQSNFAKAATVFQKAYEDRKGIDSEPGMFQALEGVVWSLLSLGDAEGAKPKLQECLLLRPDLNSDTVTAQTLECVALFSLKTGRPDNALMYLAAADRLREVVKSSRSVQFAGFLKKWKTEAEEALSPDDSSSAWKQGRDENLENLLRRADVILKA